MHLDERLAEYVYEELPGSEMAEARRHVATCADCKARVDDFERIHLALKAMPDIDPPRRVVIEQAKQPRPRVFAPVRWLAPIGAAAALVLALAVAGPIHAEWHDSQFTIAFGKTPAAPAVTSPAASTPVQPVDYERIINDRINELRVEQQAWIAQQIAHEEMKLAAAYGKELTDVNARLAYLRKFQQDTWNATQTIGGSIQLLAQKSGD